MALRKAGWSSWGLRNISALALPPACLSFGQFTGISGNKVFFTQLQEERKAWTEPQSQRPRSVAIPRRCLAKKKSMTVIVLNPFFGSLLIYVSYLVGLITSCPFNI